MHMESATGDVLFDIQKLFGLLMQRCARVFRRAPPCDVLTHRRPRPPSQRQDRHLVAAALTGARTAAAAPRPLPLLPTARWRPHTACALPCVRVCACVGFCICLDASARAQLSDVSQQASQGATPCERSDRACRYEQYTLRTGQASGVAGEAALEAIRATLRYAQQYNSAALLSGAQQAAAAAWLQLAEVAFTRQYAQASFGASLPQSLSPAAVVAVGVTRARQARGGRRVVCQAWPARYAWVGVPCGAGGGHHAGRSVGGGSRARGAHGQPAGEP